MEYNIKIPEYTEFEKKLQNERDFFAYMQLLEKAKKDYLIIVTVSDTPAGPLFTPNHSTVMMNALGLKINMVQAYRQPYVAIIDHGNVVFEKTSKDVTKSITINANFNTHTLNIYSGGFDCIDIYNFESFVKFDESYYYGCRGFNFFIINPQRQYMVDFYHYETYEIQNIDGITHKPFLCEEKIASIIENNSWGGGGIKSLYFVYYCITLYFLVFKIVRTKSIL